jgi:hypothetical protein
MQARSYRRRQFSQSLPPETDRKPTCKITDDAIPNICSAQEHAPQHHLNTTNHSRVPPFLEDSGFLEDAVLKALPVLER